MACRWLRTSEVTKPIIAIAPAVSRPPIGCSTIWSLSQASFGLPCSMSLPAQPELAVLFLHDQVVACRFLVGEDLERQRLLLDDHRERALALWFDGELVRA